jgi:hypothetical protein
MPMAHDDRVPAEPLLVQASCPYSAADSAGFPDRLASAECGSGVRADLIGYGLLTLGGRVLVDQRG